MSQSLSVKAGIVVLKPQYEVFEAIINPVHMSQYFISKGSGKMEEGKIIQWQFPEMDMEFPVRIGKVEQDKYISFYWNDVDNTELTVEITLIPKDLSATFVSITEKERANDEAGIAWLRRNTEGWANFLACLKAYLEYGINLRKGAFDMSQMPE